MPPNLVTPVTPLPIGDHFALLGIYMDEFGTTLNISKTTLNNFVTFPTSTSKSTSTSTSTSTSRSPWLLGLLLLVATSLIDHKQGGGIEADAVQVADHLRVIVIFQSQYCLFFPLFKFSYFFSHIIFQSPYCLFFLLFDFL